MTIFVLLVVSIICSGALGLNVNVPAHAEVCFYSPNLDADDTLMGSYDVSSGGLLDIDVKVTGPGGPTDERYSVFRQTGGTFSTKGQVCPSFFMTNLFITGLFCVYMNT